MCVCVCVCRVKGGERARHFSHLQQSMSRRRAQEAAEAAEIDDAEMMDIVADDPVAPEKEKKKKNKKKKKKTAKDGIKLTKTMATVFKMIKNTSDGTPNDAIKPISNTIFSRRLRAEAERQRPGLALGNRPLTYSKSVIHRVKFLCDHRLTLIATIAARALEETGQKNCSISALHMARDIYDLVRRGAPVRLHYLDALRAKYDARRSKVSAGRVTKKGTSS